MVRVLAGGPELADDSGAMVASTHVRQEHPAAPMRERAAPAHAHPRRGPRYEDALFVGYYVVIASVLAAAGYPSWRITLLAIPALVPRATFYLFSRAPGAPRHDPRRCVNADVEEVAWRVVLLQASLVASTSLAAATTGGIRSPLLVTLLSPYLAAVAVVGDRKQTRLLLGATAIAVCLLALLPRPLTGPDLASSAQMILTAVSVLGVGALAAPVHAIARIRSVELARWRKEMAADALVRAQSLEQIGSKVAHELKNPLTGVKALVQLGLRNPAEASSHERLEVVDREVTRMQEILQNYLSFTRPLQGVAPEPVALGPLVSDTLVVLSARADDARVRLYAQGDAAIEADPRRLKEALLNLVANAIEATPPGGQVEVEVRPAGEEAEIVVRDTGRGMTAETMRHIGTPFFTTRDEGTGLGVVLARSVIAQHGGSLRYESEPGQGTRVRVALPRTRGDRDAACAARR
jgi:signal transduction histidine kinase